MLMMAGCNAISRQANPIEAVFPAPAYQAGSSNSSQTATRSAPNTHVRFSRLDLKDGLSQSVVMAILQDDRGFLWFGTQDGLNRYDGSAFRVYRPDPTDPYSINDIWINCLTQDRSGMIWIGTRQGGLNRFDPHTGQFIHYLHDPDDPHSLSDNQILSLHEDNLGRLWVGTAVGLDRFEKGEETFNHFVGDSPEALIRTRDAITAVYRQGDGKVWIGTSQNGLILLDLAADEYTTLRSVTGDDTSLSNNSIHAIQPARNGSLWVATAAGLNNYDQQAERFTRYLHNEAEAGSLGNNLVHAIHIDPAGRVWVGTHEGLDRFDERSQRFVHYRNDPNRSDSLSNDTILSVTADQGGVLWVGTFGGGLSLFDPGENKFANYQHELNDPNSLSGNNVFPIYADPTGGMWVGTYGDGLNHFDPETETFTIFRHDPADLNSLQSDRIFAVVRDRSRQLWVGTETGLDRFAPDLETVTHYQLHSGDEASLPGVEVHALIQDRLGHLWIGTTGGLARYDPATDSFVRYQNHPGDVNSLSENQVVAIAEDAAGMLWIGTFNGGMDHFDPATGKFLRYAHADDNPNTLSNNSVLTIYIDPQGILWIGTAGGGLNRYDPGSGRFSVYRVEQGLASNVVYGILPDDAGHLWMSTNGGLSRLDSQTGEFVNYTVDDGLQGNEFSMGAYARDSAGRLYFGGINGFNMFTAADLYTNSNPPPVVLLTLTQNGQPVIDPDAASLPPEVTIRYPKNEFEFEFAALSYSRAERNQYAYMLEGFDKNWYFSGTTRAGRYSNLPGGTYTLHINAANSDGIWGREQTAIQIKVVPPAWGTWWFRGLALLLAAALGYGGYQARVKGIESRSSELERQVRERTREIESLFEKTKELAVLEERNRLARELHDSAKQKAFAALAQLGTVKGLLRSNPQGAQNHLREAENLVYEVIQEMTFLIQEIYPTALKEKGLAAMLREYAFEWETRSDIAVELKIENEQRLPLEVEQAIYRTVQEALANVARHSKADSVQIRVTYDGDTLQIFLADNGRGFNLHQRSNGLGLLSMRERIDSVGGQLRIQSAAGEGTRIDIQIPISTENGA
jgi:ligand-binding sensor domain-containing protein/signal transduction histidine kinase